MRKGLTLEEREAFSGLLTTFTAWLIDTGRAIKNGGFEQREAAIAQADALVDDIDKLLTRD